MSHTTVGQLRNYLGYRRPSTRTRYEGTSHADREAQFDSSKARVQEFQQRTPPVVSVDTTKQEFGGNCAKRGRAYPPKGGPKQSRRMTCRAWPLARACPLVGLTGRPRQGGYVWEPPLRRRHVR